MMLARTRKYLGNIKGIYLGHSEKIFNNVRIPIHFLRGENIYTMWKIF